MINVCHSPLQQKARSIAESGSLPVDINLPESVHGLTANRGDESIVPSKFPVNDKPVPAFGHTNGRAKSVWRNHNLTAMVRRMSQAEHKCPLDRGSQGLRRGLGLLSPEGYYVVAKAVGQNSIAGNTGTSIESLP